jgi:hypothetical protein
MMGSGVRVPASASSSDAGFGRLGVDIGVSQVDGWVDMLLGGRLPSSPLRGRAHAAASRQRRLEICRDPSSGEAYESPDTTATRSGCARQPSEARRTSRSKSSCPSRRSPAGFETRRPLLFVGSKNSSKKSAAPTGLDQAEATGVGERRADGTDRRGEGRGKLSADHSTLPLATTA